MDKLLELQNVSLAYRALPALRAIDWSIRIIRQKTQTAIWQC